MLAPRLYGCALVHPIIRELGHKDRRMHQGHPYKLMANC